MATRDPPDLEPLDKVRLVLDYMPAEALESIAEDEEERRLLASLDERIDRDVEATRVQDATVVVERPSVVEVLGVTCAQCGTPFQVEADGPLPRPLSCPSCAADGTLEPRGEAAAFVLDEDEAPVVVPDPDLDEEEPAEVEEEPEAEAFSVPEDEGDRSAVLVPSDADEAAPTMQPAVDPVDALVPDEEPGEDEGERDAVEDILAPGEGAVETADEDGEEPGEAEDDEYTFTPPTAEQDDEGDQAVQDLLDEDFDLDQDEDEGADEDEGERGEAFDDVDWPEEEEDEDEAFSVVAPLGEEPEEAPDPEEELVDPDEEPEEDWPEAQPVDDGAEEEPGWPELDDEAGDDEPADEAEDEEAWPEIDEEAEDEGGSQEAAEDDEASNPGNSAEAAGGDDEIPSEWAGRDLDAEDEPDDGPAAGARGGLPVDQIPGVEDFYADQLAANGYETTADLAADEAWRIGDETGIASALVKKWRRTATLVQELGMGTGYASVLAEAEVGGPDTIRGVDPEDVAATVNDQLGASDLELDPVTPEDVAAWTGGA